MSVSGVSSSSPQPRPEAVQEQRKIEDKRAERQEEQKVEAREEEQQPQNNEQGRLNEVA